MRDHLIAEFMKIGCKTKKDAAITFQVYLELCEVKKYWDVEYLYSKETECMYVTGRKSKSGPICVFVPVPAADDITFVQMQKYLGLSQAERKTVYLAMVESDSTCVYYQISDGISDPPQEVPGVSRDEKRNKLDGELRKHREILEESALHGIPITLNRNAAKKVKNDGNSVKDET